MASPERGAVTHYRSFTSGRHPSTQRQRLAIENPITMNAIIRKNSGNLLAYALLLALGVLGLVLTLG